MVRLPDIGAVKSPLILEKMDVLVHVLHLYHWKTRKVKQFAGELSMRWVVGVLCLLSFRATFEWQYSTNAADSTPLKLLYLGDNGPHQPRARFGQLQPVLKPRGIELEYTAVAGDLRTAADGHSHRP